MLRFLAAAVLMLLPGTALAQAVTRNLTLEANLNEYPPVAGSPFGAGYSSCWSYIHGDGREYAAIGTTNGTAIYNVTDPDAVYRVGFIPGPYSAWREMKSYRNWIYIVTEGDGPGLGVQVVRMTDPEAPLLVATYTGAFHRSHTVSVDTARALLVCNGTTGASGSAGLRVLSLANPEAPVEVGAWPAGTPPFTSDLYVHDSVPIGNRLYASSIYAGIQRILDFTNPAAISQVSGWSYPGAFTHNAWPDETGSFLYVTDEVNGEPLKVFDISSPGAPALAGELTANPLAIVHNAHVKGNELYLANYTEGIRVLDLSDPAHPAEFAWGDSYPGPSGGYFGVWGVCPFFPSGTVIASDMQTGLYVYRPVRDYGILRVAVDDGGPAANVKVRLTTTGDSLVTGSDGIVQFAPNPGLHTVRVSPFGYYDAEAQVMVTPGSRDTVTLSLVPRPRRDLAGTIRDAGTLAGLEDAELDLLYTPIHAHTTVDGSFLEPLLPEDTYQAEARAPGHIGASFPLAHQQFSPGPDLALPATATWDAMEVVSGWVVGGAGTGDDATSGVWVRVEPLGTGEPQAGSAAGVRAASGGWKPGPDPLHEGHETDGVAPGDVQPEYDRTPPPGIQCFVTGQGTTPSSIGQADVDNGHTTLTSPTLDLTGMADPVIGFWRWFYGSSYNDDLLIVLLSNDGGASWTAVDTVRGIQAHWEEEAVHVNDHLPATATMKLRFVAADLDPQSIVEAAIDDVVTYDGADAPAVDVGPRPAPAALRFRAAFPNPASAPVRLVLELPATGPMAVDVLDVQGRRVRSLEHGQRAAGLHTLVWDGRDESGRLARAGLYFVRARASRAEAMVRVVRIE